MGLDQQKRFFGKYRGMVVNNKDPLMIGRIQAKVPTVFGDTDSGWALPCVPFADKGIGFFFIPPIGANVWIEFEGGNVESPIWSGCYWSLGEIPEVQRAHRNIKNALLYPQLMDTKQEEYVCKIAENKKDIEQLIEDGSEYVCEQQNLKFFRKRK